MQISYITQVQVLEHFFSFKYALISSVYTRALTLFGLTPRHAVLSKFIITERAQNVFINWISYVCTTSRESAGLSSVSLTFLRLQWNFEHYFTYKKITYKP